MISILRYVILISVAINCSNAVLNSVIDGLEMGVGLGVGPRVSWDFIF